MGSVLVTQLAVLLGSFAIGTAVGDFLKDFNNELIHHFGRALKLLTGIATGVMTMFAAYTGGIFTGAPWIAIILVMGIVVALSIIFTWYSYLGSGRSRNVE